MSENNEYTVTELAGAIHHNGSRYDAGEQIELSAKEAKHLLAIGHVTGATPAPEVDRTSAIVAAIESLDSGNDELWTSDGKPKTDAIEAVTGFNVPADERDQVWAAMAG